MDLVVRGPLNGDAIHTHLQQSDNLEQVRLDLTALTFCEPIGLVTIAALVESSVGTASVRVISPRDLSRANYLARMRLGEVLERLGADHDLPRVTARAGPDVLLELQPFYGPKGMQRVSNMVLEAVQPFGQQVGLAISDGLVEASDNVLRHARLDHGFVAAQKTHGGSRLHVAVADSGVGLLATLAASTGVLTHAEALSAAVTRGVTEDVVRGAGQGLSTILKGVCDLGGTLRLASGDSSLRASRSGTATTRSRHTLTGTILQGSVPAARR